jgi:hypothetical protein
MLIPHAGVGVGVASAIVVGDFSHALDLCDSHRQMHSGDAPGEACQRVTGPYTG